MAYKYDNELQAREMEHSAMADYYSRLKNLACTMFKWNGLPDTVNARYLEETLFMRGCAVFFRDDSLGDLALPGTLQGVNIFGDPIKIRPYAKNGAYFADLENHKKCVLIRNTPDMFPTIITTMRYTKILYDIDNSIDVNIKAQKTPVLILTNRKQKTSAEAVYQKYVGNAPVIFAAEDTFDPNAFRVFRTDAPFVAGQLQDIKMTKYNEYLSFLGIGMTDEKKERRITGEVEPYEQKANALANIGFSQRQEACKEINKLFGLNVSVELATDTYSDDSAKFSKSASTVNYITADTTESQTQ